ncbi:MAG: TonB family protein [Acidobacteria bacterium]|nr:TonB family protein [Acidobacteriota bacterium]
MAKKILLIEYEPRYLERIRGYLAGKDFDLVVAKDGDEGLEAYRSSRPDLVVISSVLPKLRTPDVIKGMQASGPTPPIVLMMTGYKGKDKKADAQKVGASSILEKPFAEDSFLSEVQAALGPVGDSVFPAAASAEPLLSSDDIFSDVISGMEEEPRASLPSAPGTDPGIQKKLEQTLSGILPGPKKMQNSGASPRPDFSAAIPPASPPAPVSGGERTVRLEAIPAVPGAAQKAAERTGPVKIDPTVDKMLSETLSGLKGMGPGRSPDRGPAPSAPASPPARPVEQHDAIDKTTKMTTGFEKRPDFAAPRPVAAPVPVTPPAASVTGSKPAPVIIKPAPIEPLSISKPAPSISSAVNPAPPAEQKPAGKKPGPVTTGDFGRYQLLEKIASGGMAEVFKARMRGEEGFEKIVAIKRILPHMADNDDFITMFIDEAKLAAQLNHNNIIHIYELGKVGAYHYIAMEYIDGMDLRTILKLAREREFPLPPELAIFVASKIANALDYAHRRVGTDGKELNLIHRDVSPQNILLSFEGDIKLCDFGIAKATTKVSQTQTGALKGKLQYMSPEQAWGKKLDKRTDIFSLGVVLYELLTGDKLFTGDTDLTLLEQVRDAKAVAPSEKNMDVPAKVDQVVLRALAKNADERYQNANEFEKELNAVLYSFQPAPGPADLAIYMHRLMESTPSVSDEQIDAAFALAEKGSGLPAEPQKKGKGLVISKKAAVPEVPVPRPVPADVVEEPVVEEPPKSRAGLFIGIGVAAVVLAAAGIFLTKGGKEKGPAPQPTPAVAVQETPGVQPTPMEAEKKLDQKALEEELKKRVEAEKKKLLEAAKPTDVPKGAVVPAAPTVSLAPKGPLEPPKVAEAPRPTVPAPTAVPPTQPPKVAEAPKPTEPPRPAVEPPTPIPAAPAPVAAAVKEGDLVGEGEGVNPPKLVKLGAFAGLPPQARDLARKRGGQGFETRILALITEKGQVSESRVLVSSGYKFVDDAALNALKSATIEPATKGGVRVKMWKAFPIKVNP